METIYKKIETLFRASAKKHNLLLKKEVLNSKAKIPKTQLHIYGREEVKIDKRPKQKTSVVGLMIHKDYVGFYSMGVYAFPQEFNLSPTFQKMLKGKSCFYLREINPTIEKEISKIIEKNIKLFKKQQWI